MQSHPKNNVPENIYEKIGRNLHLKPNHPLNILRTAIYQYFDTLAPGRFNKFDTLAPVVSIVANFDEVLVPADHVSRSPNDTYYVDDQSVLRCHTSAHQAEMLRKGETGEAQASHHEHKVQSICTPGTRVTHCACRGPVSGTSTSAAFLVTGDVYRRDAIDATHYPVFHQMEGVRVFTREEWEAAGHEDGTKMAEVELKKALEGLARHLFG